MIDMDPTVNAQVTRRFDDPPERVYDAWLDVRAVRHWFRPGFGSVVCVDMDTRPGGSFYVTEERDGDDVEHTGAWLELERPARIAFTWRVSGSGDSSKVAVDIARRGAGSELALTHELHDPGARTGVEEAWRHMLDALACWLARRP
jgi:uncharacterized protein YndB with AHSA1/START domain